MYASLTQFWESAGEEVLFETLENLTEISRNGYGRSQFSQAARDSFDLLRSYIIHTTHIVLVDTNVLACTVSGAIFQEILFRS